MNLLTCIQLPCWLLHGHGGSRVLIRIFLMNLATGCCVTEQSHLSYSFFKRLSGRIMLQNEIRITWWREVLWCGDEPDQCSSCCQEPYLESWSKIQVLSSAISVVCNNLPIDIGYCTALLRKYYWQKQHRENTSKHCANTKQTLNYRQTIFHPGSCCYFGLIEWM